MKVDPLSGWNPLKQKKDYFHFRGFYFNILYLASFAYLMFSSKIDNQVVKHESKFCRITVQFVKMQPTNKTSSYGRRIALTSFKIYLSLSYDN